MESDILKDSRFAKYLNDPRYRQIPKSERKVKIDKRFQSMFNDGKFKVKYTVDKRGRPINETSTENLRKYYDLESEEEPSSENDEEDEEENTSGRFVKRPSSERDTDEDESTIPKIKNDKLVRGKLDKKTTQRLLDLDTDYARGEGFLATDSSSDEDSSDDTNESELEHEWGELDADAETTEQSTKRIAVCNMDWDNIKAIDIMVLFNSFLPPGGIIHKVTIYPSEFGKQRMQEEELRGPIELTETKAEHSIGEEDNEEGSSYHMEKLRKYQLNRLKYFYAVAEFDSLGTADKIYSECDGMEYESSATKLDLRFIPDNVSFDEDKPKEVCTKLPDLSRYKPRLFLTTALQQAKVDLTWDATNPNRTETIKSVLSGNIDDICIKEYLASSSDDGESDEDEKKEETIISDTNEDPISKYKSLLEEIKTQEERKKNKDLEMEISWELGVKEKVEQLVKKKVLENTKDLTPFEKLIEKRKEMKKQKKLERQKKLDSSQSQDESDDEIPSDIDLNDPYFAEEFNKPEFKKLNIGKNKKVSESQDIEGDNRKAELELLLDDDDGKSHFSLKMIQEAENDSKKSKRKKKLKEKMKECKVDDFSINVEDKRFSALFESHHYNIDPNDPNYKKTKNMEKLIQEKLKRRPVEASDPQPISKMYKKDAEISLLVKNIKRKTNNIMKN